MAKFSVDPTGATPIEGKDSRQEVYAQHRALGKPGSECYSLAGYSPHPSAYQRLDKMPKIKARVEWLRANVVEPAIRKNMENAVMDRAYVLDNLAVIVEDCMSKARPDDLNSPMKNHQSAINALRLVGVELGMFVARHEDVTDRGGLARLEAEALAEERRELDKRRAGLERMRDVMAVMPPQAQSDTDQLGKRRRH